MIGRRLTGLVREQRPRPWAAARVPGTLAGGISGDEGVEYYCCEGDIVFSRYHVQPCHQGKPETVRRRFNPIG